MAIAAVIDLDGMTGEEHEALMREMGLAGQPAAAAAGLIFHVSGPIPEGWRVLDVWESPEAAERFQRERLQPAVEKLGDLRQPRVQVMPVHEMAR
jgi:hypothetical protein